MSSGSESDASAPCESRAAFRSGVRDVLPALPANVPFGVIAGVATVGAGFDPVQTAAFAGMLFAGAGAVAWRTESMLWTIVVGMVALWTLEWLPLGL